MCKGKEGTCILAMGRNPSGWEYFGFESNFANHLGYPPSYSV